MIDTSFIEAWTELLLDLFDSVTLESCSHCKQMFDSVSLFIKNAGFEGIDRVLE